MFDSTALAVSTCLESVQLEHVTVIRKFTNERGWGNRLGRMTNFFADFPNLSHIAEFPICGFSEPFLYNGFPFQLRNDSFPNCS